MKRRSHGPSTDANDDDIDDRERRRRDRVNDTRPATRVLVSVGKLHFSFEGEKKSVEELTRTFCVLLEWLFGNVLQQMLFHARRCKHWFPKC